MAPRTVLDYVVAHEVAHLIHPNHTEAFWGTLDRIMPDYRDRKGWLRQHGVDMTLQIPAESYESPFPNLAEADAAEADAAEAAGLLRIMLRVLPLLGLSDFKRSQSKTIASDRAILQLTAKGISVERVHLATRSRKGYWRMSQNSLLRAALNNRWLEEQGVPDMRAIWIVLHYGLKARV